MNNFKPSVTVSNSDIIDTFFSVILDRTKVNNTNCEIAI